jgi:ketosteroid isomerase-like protein
MTKLAMIAATAIGLLLTSALQFDEEREACIKRCKVAVPPEMYRQEIVSLEREAAHAIELRNGTFFRRVYGDDFVGTLSHGQQVNRAEWVAAIESGAAKYDSFNSSDIKVQIYEDTAVATCLWSARGVMKGQRFNRQLRVIHVYLDTASGWRVVSGQITSMPPDFEGLL